MIYIRNKLTLLLSLWCGSGVVLYSESTKSLSPVLENVVIKDLAQDYAKLDSFLSAVAEDAAARIQKQEFSKDIVTLLAQIRDSIVEYSASTSMESMLPKFYSMIKDCDELKFVLQDMQVLVFTHAYMRKNHPKFYENYGLTHTFRLPIIDESVYGGKDILAVQDLMNQYFLKYGELFENLNDGSKWAAPFIFTCDFCEQLGMGLSKVDVMNISTMMQSFELKQTTIDSLVAQPQYVAFQNRINKSLNECIQAIDTVCTTSLTDATLFAVTLSYSHVALMIYQVCGIYFATCMMEQRLGDNSSSIAPAQ